MARRQNGDHHYDATLNGATDNDDDDDATDNATAVTATAADDDATGPAERESSGSEISEQDDVSIASRDRQVFSAADIGGGGGSGGGGGGDSGDSGGEGREKVGSLFSLWKVSEP